MKKQLNVRAEEDLIRDLKVEAATMGISLHAYVELILTNRGKILK